MGWESELSINGLLCDQWRNFAPSQPTLLFRMQDLVITPGSRDGEDEYSDSIVWSTTAKQALENLAASGFSWDLLLRDYAESRDYSLEAAFLRGLLEGRLGSEKYAEALSLIEAISPSEDLRTLATTVFSELEALNKAWVAGDLTDPPTPVRELLLFDGFRRANRIALDDNLAVELRIVLTRSLDYFMGISRSTHLVGWAFTMVQLLYHAPPEAEVHFDISGGLGDTPPSDYAEQFWSSARMGLSQEARFYGHVFAGLSSATSDFAQAAQYGSLETLLAAATEPGISNAVKGLRLEELVARLLELPGTGLPILEKRLKHADEELDLVLRNDLDESFWRNLSSPVVLVECKNWSSRVDINELRVLETKMRDRKKLCSVGFFFSLHGFTQPFLQRARDLQASGLTVFPIDGNDLREILRERVTLPHWVSEKGLRRIL